MSLVAWLLCSGSLKTSVSTHGARVTRIALSVPVKRMTKTTSPKETFLSKLKGVCENCTKQTVLVYFRNVRRLYRLVESDKDKEVPLSGDWLGKKELFEKYAKQPLKVRRHLSSAAVKASKAYKKNSEKWEVKMYKDASLYERQRSKNKRSDKEKEAWPKGGMASIRRASREQWKRVKVLLHEEPNLKVLYKYQMFLALKLFADTPFRNLFPSFSLKKNDGNYIERPKKGNFTFVVQKHKASKKLGTREVPLNRASTMAVRKFLKYREQVPEVKHDFLLSSKTGGKMSKGAFGKALHRVTRELLGKSFGSRLIRVLAATDMKEEIDKVALLGSKMLHSAGTKQTKAYTRN